jgi:hypothetical protein
MIDTITAIGFHFNRTCNCDGQKTAVYIKGDYEIRHRIRRNTYKLRKYRVSQTGWISADQLQIKLNEIFQVATVTV